VKRGVLAAAVLIFTEATVPARLSACGDKFLLPPGGLSFEKVYRADHPGAVLIYAPPGSTADYTRVQAMLTKVGHRVTVLEDDNQLTQAIAAGTVDVIVTDLRDAGLISSKTATSRLTPSILAVLDRPTKTETEACKLKYRCDLRSTDKPERFVVAVNATMNDRAKGLPQKHGD